MIPYRVTSGGWGWLGQAMVLGNCQYRGILLIGTTVEGGPTLLAVGAGGVVWTFLLPLSLSLSLSLGDGQM